MSKRWLWQKALAEVWFPSTMSRICKLLDEMNLRASRQYDAELIEGRRLIFGETER